MNWTTDLRGRLFSFADDQLYGVFLDDCLTLDDDGMWVTDVLIGGEMCRAIINWTRLIDGPRDGRIQMYLPDFIWQRGFDDVKLQA
jgi:hypothetical protein